MESQIIYIHSRMKHYRAQAIIVGFLAMLTATMFISLYEGNPFPHVIEYGTNVQGYDGWILEETHLWLLVGGAAIFVEGIWQIQYLKFLYQPLASLLEDKCDPEVLRWATMYGIQYCEKRKGHKTAIYYFEHYLIMALNALGEFEEAIDYLEHSWRSEKQKQMREKWLIIAKMNDASEKGNVIKYKNIVKNLPPTFQKDPEVRAQILILQGNYEDALNIFQRMRGRNMFSNVSKHAGIAECYVKMGKKGEAVEHLNFVIAHGNTTMYKQKALKDLGREE